MSLIEPIQPILLIIRKSHEEQFYADWWSIAACETYTEKILWLLSWGGVNPNNPLAYGHASRHILVCSF